jgi:hypothetical protein
MVCEWWIRKHLVDIIWGIIPTFAWKGWERSRIGLRVDFEAFSGTLLYPRLLTELFYNLSARTTQKTPSSIVKNASLLLRYLVMDVLLSRARVLRECVYLAVP